MLAWIIVLVVTGLAGALAWVLYRELRNQHHMWHDECITPDPRRAEMREVLRGFREAFDGQGITWWLDYGTLLGAWRLGTELPFDHDVDISFLAEHEGRVRACVPALAARGIELNLERTSIFYKGRKIGDAEPWFRHGERLCRDDPAKRTGVNRFWRPLRDDFPPDWIAPLWAIRFDGDFYPCPNHPDRFLRRRYFTCRVHLRLAIPGRQKCWTSRAFWRESLRIWRMREAPVILERTPVGHGGG